MLDSAPRQCLLQLLYAFVRELGSLQVRQTEFG
jgi:hypothetical protein